MKSTDVLLVTYCAAAALAGCAPRVDVEAERRALMDADRAFADATATRGVDGWTAFFTDDGVMLPAGAPLTEGKPAIRARMARSLTYPGFSLLWQPLRAEVSRSGDLGYTIGRFEASTTSKTGERTVLQRGKYVSIWRKQKDGSWKVAVDIGNPGDPNGPES